MKKIKTIHHFDVRSINHWNMFTHSSLYQVLKKFSRKISVSFPHWSIFLSARLRTPTEIFRIRNSHLTANQHAEFDLRLIKSRDPYTNLTGTTLEHFQLKGYPPHNAHLIVTKELNAFEEIELHIQMKTFTNQVLNSMSMMKILIYVSQYDFYP